MTCADAMDAYPTGGVDRSAASATKITATATTSTTTTYLHLRPQTPVTQRKNNNHQNIHHELAPRQEYLGQGWKETRNNVARVVVGLLGACGPPVEKNNVCVGPASFAQSALRVSLDVQPRRPCSRKEDIYIYRPVQPREKNYLPAP